MKQSLKPYFFWENEYFLRGLFLFNSLLVFWYFSNSIVGNKTPATSLLLLLSLLFLIPALKNLSNVWATQKWWILALLAFGGFHVLHLYLHGTEVGDDYDKPTKAIAAVLIFLYLLRYGFSDKVVGVAIAVSAVAAGGYALYEKFYLGLPRAGMLTNPIRYGYLVVTMASICLFYCWYSKKPLLKSFYLVAGCVGLLGAFVTGTRGVVLILCGIILFVSYQAIKQNLVSFRNLLVALTLGILGFAVIVLTTDIADRHVKQTFHEIESIATGQINTEIGYRLQMWHLALYLGKEEPLLGVGIDYDVIRQKSAEFIETHGYSPAIVYQVGHFHNQFLDSLVKQGVPGLLVWCLLLIAASSGMGTRYKYGVLLIVATMMIGGLTEAVLRSSRLFYLMVIGISIFRCLDYQAAWSKRTIS
ncbi:O-antigen ligase family protein [Neptuniibacter sp. CAU 1671]|uniref:O-antigen ligase family protein n=1 Tax=Neptuniibacter sp. CAU 1671 TaxID=3032593 RepID=UPI0023DA6F31|nr:O-antigen ligase family protein [Neptuniibacter sp. CAU 1671]MDF2182173.1 O-antigen ligase family protein [Neptuniibacter sp. CAU 1671]